MSETPSLLQRFFDASLIPSDTTDERLKHYEAAAADLAQRFAESPRDAVSASRVAIDRDCPANDPWFNEVQDAVKAHWKTFLIRQHDAPRQICRAILLEALITVAKEDQTVGLAIWYATSSLLPHLTDSPDLEITREVISGLGDICEKQSSLKWHIGASNSAGIPEFEFKLPAIKVIQIDEVELTKGFSDAAGPNDVEGQSHGNPNSYWPNSAQNWAHQFAPRAAKAVASNVNKALTATSPAIKALNDQLALALKKHANSIGTWVIESAQRNERLTAMLWWQQAHYSPSLKRTYRDLSPTEIAIALPYDLGNVTGAPVPLSVEYFLRETFRSLLPENPKLTLSEMAAAAKNGNQIAPCLPVTELGTPRRVSLSEYLSVVRQTAHSDETMAGYVGVDPSTCLPVAEWGVWLLRERLAEILTATEE